ncbi:MAG: GH92 family glycosyl hydrolase, partial [Candidatus Kryptoniota bacterium]
MNWKRAFVLVTGMLCIAAMSQDGYSQRLKELADYVNPYIGSISPKTGGTSPLVYVPHGTIEVAPDFTPDIGDEYLADKIFGFPAGPASIMATTGELKIDRGENASGFDHTMETATPYYYQALLEDLNINAEYTVTDHSIIFRFTFPESAGSNILMNIFRNGSIEIVGDNSIEGSGNIRYYKSTFGVMADDTVYFHAEFNKPLKVFGTWKDKNIARGVKTQMGDKIGAFISFLTAKDEQVEIKVGTSYNSIDEARANLVKEIPGWDFARVKKAAKESWNKALNLIKTEGGTEDQRISFYTALYRTMGRKGNVWDAYRCAYPLQTIIEPDETVKTIEEFVDIYKKTGWLPSSGAMIGNHSTAVITDAYTKGLRGFDVEKAYEGMKKNATEATMIPWQDAGHITELEKCYFEKGFYPALPVREDMKVQDERKWLADDGEITYSNMPYQVTWLPEVGVKEWVKEVDPWHRRQSVSVTLESAYDDWCLAQMSKALGKDSDYTLFIKRAHNYQNLYDSTIGFMAPKTADGQWVRPYDPKLSGGFAGEAYFAECNSWIYTYSVQQDVEGLINLMGGREDFNKKLDQLFVEQPDPMDKPAFLGQFPDMSGLIGMYCQGNEPAFHIPYLYDFSGEPWKTQKMVSEIMQLWYNSGPFGLPGDDDGGAMSSWYVFSAMGFYPVTPGCPDYEIGSPIFNKVVINVGGGRAFVIEAKQVSEKNKYIQSAMLDGKALNKPWIE